MSFGRDYLLGTDNKPKKEVSLIQRFRASETTRINRNRVGTKEYQIQCLFRKNVMAVSKRLRWMVGDQSSGKCSTESAQSSRWYQGKIHSTGVNHNTVYHGQYGPD